MVITEGQVAQVASEMKKLRGGVDNDYFGLLFMEKEFKLSREEACEQIAYGGNASALMATTSTDRPRIFTSCSSNSQSQPINS